MIAPWAREEMATVDLNDKRLHERLAQIVSDLGSRPTASIPAACGGHKEMVAAYRFFDNEKVTYEKILQPHYDCTRRRLAAQQTVLLIQDTTEVDLTRPQQQVAGAGPMSDAGRRGAFAHILQAFTTDGTPLGAVWVDLWARQDDTATAAEKKQRRREAGIEEKESFRWLEGLRQSRAVAQEVPAVRCVCIGDSEADIYELFAEPRGEQPVHWLIRSCHANRVLQPSDTEAAAAEDHQAAQHLRERVLATPVLFTKEISVRGRGEPKVPCAKGARHQPRQSRKTQVEVRATTVTLQPPRRPDRVLPPVTINVVLVREIGAPADDVPVEWLLLTTLSVETIEQVQEIVAFYTVRFLIEVFFKVVKSGCRIEERRFEALDRLLPCLAVYLIVAWRTLMLCRLGQSSPDLDCEAVFEPSEWQAVWKVMQQGALPAAPPKLQVILKLIAQLGGYVNRPGRKDPPGPQTIWLGLQRMRDLAWAWDTFGPGAANEPTATAGDV